MLKRQASGSKATRKKRKGNATYSTSTLDSINNDKEAVENVRIWNISTSENTGRMTASRKTLKHYYQVPPEASTTGVSSEGVEVVADVEDDGAFADSEWPSGVDEKGRKKRKRIRATKENDSVSVFYHLFFSISPAFPDEDGILAAAPQPCLSRRGSPPRWTWKRVGRPNVVSQLLGTSRDIQMHRLRQGGNALLHMYGFTP